MAVSTIKKGFKIEQILNVDSTSLSSSEYRSFSCNWKNYDMLLLMSWQYGNQCEEMLITNSYFASTTQTRKPLLNDVANNITYQAFQNGDSSVKLASTKSDSALGFRIFGIKF